MRTNQTIDCCKRSAVKILIALFIGLYSLSLFAQTEPRYKNTIKYNFTNPLIFGSKTIIFGYERKVSDNQTFSVNGGTIYFPRIFSTNLLSNTVNLEKGGSERGLSLSADYRFYLKKLNAFKAPRGVYIGPFYSFNSFDRTNNWTFNNGSINEKAQTDLGFTIHTVGFELGYQFVFWKRFTLDMVLIGPGIANYKLKAAISSTLTVEDKKKLFDALNNFLQNKIPGYSQVIDSGEFVKSGSTNTTTAGYRYVMTIGFRF